MPSSVPEGFIINAKGDHIRIENVPELALLKDQLIKMFVNQAQEISETISSFKSLAFSELDTLCDIAAEEHGEKLGGKKGNIKITSYDGKFQIVKTLRDVHTLEEQMPLIKQLIGEVTAEWKGAASEDLKNVIDKVLKVKDEGVINMQNVRDLLGMNVKHPKWKQAMQLILDSLKVIDQRSYVNVYERGDDGRYNLIPLSIAGVSIECDEQEGVNDNDSSK